MAPVRPPSASGESINGFTYRMDDLGKTDDYGMKAWNASTDSLTRAETDLDVENRTRKKEQASMEDVALKALHVDDDPTLNPWTFRMFVLGMLRFLEREGESYCAAHTGHFRTRSLRLWLGAGHHLPLQAPIRVRFGHLLDRDQLFRGPRYVHHHT